MERNTENFLDPTGHFARVRQINRLDKLDDECVNLLEALHNGGVNIEALVIDYLALQHMDEAGYRKMRDQLLDKARLLGIKVRS